MSAIVDWAQSAFFFIIVGHIHRFLLYIGCWRLLEKKNTQWRRMNLFERILLAAKRAERQNGLATLVFTRRRKDWFSFYIKMRQLRLVFADRKTTVLPLKSQHREKREDCLKKNLSISVTPMYNLVRVCVARNQMTQHAGKLLILSRPSAHGSRHVKIFLCFFIFRLDSKILSFVVLIISWRIKKELSILSGQMFWNIKTRQRRWCRHHDAIRPPIYAAIDKVLPEHMWFALIYRWRENQPNLIINDGYILRSFQQSKYQLYCIEFSSSCSS